MTADALTPAGPDEVKRVELLLHQLEALPTLPSIAVRLLDDAAHDPTDDGLILRRLCWDPAIGSRLLRLCRSDSRGRTDRIVTVEQAIEHLGATAVRGTLLATPMLDLHDARQEPPKGSDSRTFSPESLWQHSVAVAIICRSLAGLESLRGIVCPEEAFTAGLLHDLGTLALYAILPRSFDRACALAQAGTVTLDRACQAIIGLGGHGAGRRLAEHWRLPHMLGDVLWLHGQPAASLPDLPHRPLIELVSLADAVARARYIAPAGHLPRGEDIAEMARALRLAPAQVEEVAGQVHDEVSRRAEDLGMLDPVDPGLMLRTLSRANQTLGRMCVASQGAERKLANQRRTLDAIISFHDAAAPGGSFVSVFGKVVRSAQRILGGRFFAMVYQARAGELWHFMQFAGDGRLLRSEVMEPPGGSTAVPDLADQVQISMQALSLLPWLTDYLGDARDLRSVRLLPLRCGWGVNAILIHDCPVDGVADRHQLESLSRTWAGAIAAATHHAGAKKLGEKLAESNRALLETRDELTRREKLASLGEIAAGAAHEMNNPLTVISGRAQLLTTRLDPSPEREMAGQIVDHSHRLSDMISTLRSFAEPVEPDRQTIELSDLLDSEAQALYRDREEPPDVKLSLPRHLPQVRVDPELIGVAVRELLRNAAESEGSRVIEVRVQIDPLDDRLLIQIVDDGMGLTKHALAHAFDPFFSAKSAGRQPGLGLARARRLVEAHGGQITLENSPPRGAMATIRLPDWREARGQVA
ncbi:MAG: HDOD domain-containing protein [Planctomycetota bacterium]|jgi:signal transduction histidine kinase/HD-like signal output (HDOD) protein